MSYGPPPQTYYYPAQPPPSPPPGRGKGLVIGLVAAAVLVVVVALAAAGVVLYVSGGDASDGEVATAPTPGEGDLRSTVQQYVDALNTRDAAAATELTCERAGPGAVYDTTEEMGRGEHWEVRESKILGTMATVDIAVEGVSIAVPLLVEIKDGAWCVTA